MKRNIFLTGLLMLSAIAYGQVYISDIEEVDNDIIEPEYDIADTDSIEDDTAFVAVPMSKYFYTPQVYLPHQIVDSLSLTTGKKPTRPTLGSQAMKWIEREKTMNRMMLSTRRRNAVTHPENVRFFYSDLPKAPEAVTMVVNDPTKASVNLGDITAAEVTAQVDQVEVGRQHWQNKLGINLQFSQAYVSPNWYQGGNSSLNLIADFTYSSNLNTKLHPKLLFENFFQWRTALTDAPDDQYRNYNITENRLQINTKFGYKASSKWYYTITGLFKTPVFNSYKHNTNDMTASFLSPGELNFGIGMTFNTTNKKNTLTFNATIAPLSYNLKTVISKKMSPESQGLDPGRRTKSSIGSNIDAVLNWKICYNVNWRSRIFFFTNYEYSQADWQNQFTFTINRFLTANLNVDMRYDTSIKKDKRDQKWGLLQLRELISLGFTYNINH